MLFLRNRGYTGLSVFYTILAALFWIHCKLYRLKLERFLKRELQ